MAPRWNRKEYWRARNASRDFAGNDGLFRNPFAPGARLPSRVEGQLTIRFRSLLSSCAVVFERRLSTGLRELLQSPSRALLVGSSYIVRIGQTDTPAWWVVRARIASASAAWPRD